MRLVFQMDLGTQYHRALIINMEEKIVKNWSKCLVLFGLLLGLAGVVQAEKRVINIVNHQTQGTKQWVPGTIIVNQGDEVTVNLINNVPSGLHGFRIKDYNIKEAVKKGEKKTIKFVADKAGIFKIDCQLHKAHVGGQLVVMKK